MRISSLDHLVLTVADIETSISFYRDILGMTVQEFGKGRKALCFGHQKINLHQQGREFEPKADNPTPGSADLCFLSPDSMQTITGHLKKHGIKILEGPVQRTGATGSLLSVYLRDPDRNLVEIATQLETG